MKKTMKITSALLVITMIAMLVSCSFANKKIGQEALYDEPEISSQILEEKAGQWVDSMISDYGATGVQYAVMDHGKIILSGGHGFYDTETKEKINKDTMFGIASISKMYVSASVMMLVDQGKVDIDQPVTQYIEDFTMADERYKEITVRMLLNHSSGLYGSHYGNSMLFDDADSQTQDNLLSNLKYETLKSNPGEFSVYCNDGFQLLEILVERVSGQDYSSFISESISKKIGLEHTKTPLDQFDRDYLAKGYFPGIDGALGTEFCNLIGTGGIYATAEEVVKFGEVLMGNRPEILSKKSAEAMANEEYLNGVWVSETENTVGYGLGYDSVDLAPFSSYGIKALTKGGDSVLYHSGLVLIPEHQLSVAVLSSGGSSIFDTIVASNILEEVLYQKGIISEILDEKVFEVPVKVEATEQLKDYNGVYGTVGNSYEILIENDEMRIPELLGGMVPEDTYVHVGDGKFKNPDGTIEASFDEQTNGNTYLKINLVMDFPGIGQFINVYYEGQKLEMNALDGSEQAIWEARDGKKYYAVDEKVTSTFYLLERTLRKEITVDLENGYAMGNRIVDADNAVNAVEIPIMNGRDAFDMSFFKEGGNDYLQTSGNLYISEDSIAPLAVGMATAQTIGEDGHAVWFKVDEASANKMIRVITSAGSGFAVFDAEGMPLQIPNKDGENMVTLPAGGMLVFAGEEGSIFEVIYS